MLSTVQTVLVRIKSFWPAYPCVPAGNSFVLEVVNTVLRVYDAVTGAPLLNPVDLNTFFGFPAQFNRATNVFGPGLFDPICVYDQDAGRWFLVVAAYDVNPENDERTGPSYIELAVSDTYDPTGTNPP